MFNKVVMVELIILVVFVIDWNFGEWFFLDIFSFYIKKNLVNNVISE